MFGNAEFKLIVMCNYTVLYIRLHQHTCYVVLVLLSLESRSFKPRLHTSQDLSCNHLTPFHFVLSLERFSFYCLINLCVNQFFLFICHIYPPFTRKRIVSLYFGRYVRTRLGVTISKLSGSPVFNIKTEVSR